MNQSWDVIIVGAGPTGLTLALDLGRRGVSCLLMDRNPRPSGLPKMERCNARTMEIYRRMGLSEEIRQAGFPADVSMDIFLVFSLAQPALFRLPYPSVAEFQAQIAARNDGALPREPYQLISQYTLEPLLKAHADRHPLIDVRFGHELVGFTQDADGVTVEAQRSDGAPERFRAHFMVGCDGGSSLVRKTLGIGLEGEANLLELRQGLFYAPDLFERITIGRGRHYHLVDQRSTFLIVQDDTKHFTLHSVAGEDAEMPGIFERIVGMPVDYEMKYVGRWKQNLLYAERVMDRRVFIAGDAAHLVIPTGGLGMNSGVGDAVDLGWKLAATIAGWGGPGLLESFEAERQPIAKRNVAASRFATLGRRAWRDACVPDVWETTPEGLAAREHLIRLTDVEQRKSAEMAGAELGYRYADSPIVCNESDPPPDDFIRYQPSACAGARLPHVWIAPGVSIQDLVPDGFTLIDLTNGAKDASGLAQAFGRIGAPFSILPIASDAARTVYERDLVLVRPDLHVVWRGDHPPDDPDALVARVTGH